MSSRFIMPFADVGSGIKPSSGAKLFFFETDGVTPKDTFSDQLSTPTPNTNPVVSDSNGLFSISDIYISGQYKVTLEDKDGSQIFGLALVDEYAVGDFSTNLIDDLSQAYEFDTVALMVASLVALPIGKAIKTKGYTVKGDGAAANYLVKTTAQASSDGDVIDGDGNHASAVSGVVFILQPPNVFIDVVYYGIVTSVDQTTELVDLFTNNPTIKHWLLSPKIIFNRTLITDALDTDVVCMDWSGYDYDAPNETTKAYGILSKDTSTNDTHQMITSAHHSIITLNNTGTAGTTSATERKASLVWGAGNFQLGAENKRGLRPAAISQYTKLSGVDVWGWNVRSRAPWVAIAADYEIWATGQSVTSGVDYTVTSFGIYVAASTGTTGVTEPNWTTGTQSDGGVNWTFVDFVDRSVMILDEHNRLLFGNGPLTAQFEQRTATNDPAGGDYIMRLRPNGNTKTTTVELYSTNGSGVETRQPRLVSDENGLGILTDSGSRLATFTNDREFIRNVKMNAWSTATDLDATPSVTGVSTLRTNNSGPTTITALDDAKDGQVVMVVCQDVNTTIQSSSTLLLTGSVNQVMTAWSSITFEKVPSSISARWIEIGRSIK